MLATVLANWALLLGVGLLMLGHGLQGTLLGVRAGMESFPTAITGIIMSGYSLGFLASAIFTQRLIANVGHIRVYAAMTALASSAILAHAVIIEPISWFLLRVVSGFSMSGIFIVAESWLNRAVVNEQRGQLLSIYMVVQLSFWAMGQLMLTIADPAGFILFILASIILSIAVLPILLTVSPVPALTAPRKFSLIDLYRVSPLGFVGMFGVGLAQGTFFTMAPVFGGLIGLSVANISTMMAIAIVGGVISQWPIGRLSDLMDRRQVITTTTFLAAIVMIGCFMAISAEFWILLAAICLYGGLCLPLYSLFIAYTNDFLDPEQMVGASSALVFACGIGMAVGPSASAAVMQVFGAGGFLCFLAAVHGIVGIFAVFRMTQRAAVPLEEQGQHILLPTPSPISTAIAQEAASEQGETAN